MIYSSRQINNRSISLFVDGGLLSALTATQTLPLESSPTATDYADDSLFVYFGSSSDPTLTSAFVGTLLDLRIYADTLDNR